MDAWPAELEVQSRGIQTGLTGFPVNEPPTVRLVDSDGEPVVGAEITFRMTQGSGGITAAVATTSADGVATAGTWSLASGLNTVEASLPAPFRVSPITFRATGVSPEYDISLVYETPVSGARRATFNDAAAQWESMIYGDVPDITIPGGEFTCLDIDPSGTIDDLRIYVILDSIDGPGDILGLSGPCVGRDPGWLPIVGIMMFDTADVAMMEETGHFDDVIVHEMGHVLGFGVLWDPGLLNLLVGGGGSDPHFIGVRGRAAFDREGGDGYTGLKVPVENMFGPGTRDSHWRESVFENELMTGFIDLGTLNPLSVTSVAAMEDFGYEVNYSAADGVTFAFGGLRRVPPAGSGGRLPLGDDVLRIPIYTANASGRMTGLYRQ